MPGSIPFDNLLTRLLEETRDVVLMWQVAILVACALFAWLGVRAVVPWLERRTATWNARHIGLRSIAFAGFMLLGVLIGREAVRFWFPQTHLLNLAIPLLLSLLGVRLAIHALRYVFGPRDTLKLWERVAAWLIWGAFTLHITGLRPRIHSALAALAFQAGGHRFSLLLLLQAATVIIVAIIVSLTLARVVETRLMGVTQMNLSLRMALAKTARTVFLIVAVLIALPAVGIDLTVLSVFGGALGVGIGFGLQKVASNYISGFIILLDRSVRIGDLVTVDKQYGQVSQINTRYTLLRALDGTESIVPNEMLIAQTVVNHSLSKPNVRLALPMQVAYGSDLEQAESLMLEAARSHARVIVDEADNPPRVLLKEFGDNGILLELAVWIRDPSEGQNNLRSDLNWAIWRRFQAAGIEIPYPQRVVHLARGAAPAADNP